MAQTLDSGIKKFEGTDNVSKQNMNDNWDKIDEHLKNYTKEVDLTSIDATLGIYKIVKYKRGDATLHMKATLSNPDVNGYYQTDTWQYYDAAGTTVIQTVTWTLVYDADGLVTSATYAVT